MKTILKTAVLLIFFYFCGTRVMAQTDEKAFFAIWELDQSAYYGKQEPPVRYTKTFYPDHTFINEQTQA